jgi:hypothetical protein
MNVNVLSMNAGGYIEVHLDSLTGILLGACKVKNAGDPGHWATQSCKVRRVGGVHDLYFVFEGGEGHLFNFNWWKFNKK